MPATIPGVDHFERSGTATLYQILVVWSVISLPQEVADLSRQPQQRARHSLTPSPVNADISNCAQVSSPRASRSRHQHSEHHYHKEQYYHRHDEEYQQHPTEYQQDPAKVPKSAGKDVVLGYQDPRKLASPGYVHPHTAKLPSAGRTKKA